MEKKSGSMQERLKDFGEVVLHPGVLILVSALVYLPFIGRFSYYFDDWYLMFAAGERGPEVFAEIFSVDRPGRAGVMAVLYSLFQGNPLHYNLSAYLFRLIGALGFLSVLRTLWARERAATFAMAVLFLVYPGFLSQPNAIDYQSHLAGLAAATWSIAIMLKAVVSNHKAMKTGYFIFSILLGFFYLSQIEWFIGFEAVRWACVLLLSIKTGGTPRQTILEAIRRAYPALIIPLLFLVWRLLFFQSERGATDVSLQLDGLMSTPIATIGLWGISLAQDLVDVLFLSWVWPLSRYAFTLDTHHKLVAVGLGVLAVVFTRLVMKREESVAGGEAALNPNWRREALWLGIVIIIFGLLPVTVANREVAFPAFSRYTLVASMGAVMMIVGLVYELPNKKLQEGILACLVLFSVLTHYGNGFEHARWTTVYNNYWWQVSWRVPQFEKNTTLVANIPTVATEEDYFIWGPANLIYYPESQSTKVIQPTLFAAVLNPLTVQNVLTRQRQEYDNRRGIITYKNYRNILILTQPSLDSCVHVIDGMQLEFSPFELDAVRVIGAHSEIEHILVNETPHAPPELIFGPEPPRTWCYFYQSADLARQRGDWEAVIRLGNEAHVNGFAPADLIEWMPFLQAYAVTGDVDRLIELAPIISGEPYVALQVCRNIGGLADISEAVVEVIDARYCLE